MKTILDLLTTHAGEIGTFVFTSLAAYFKRKYDLKQIKKEAEQEKHFKQ